MKLNPKTKVLLFTSIACPACVAAKSSLEAAEDVECEHIDVASEDGLKRLKEEVEKRGVAMSEIRESPVLMAVGGTGVWTGYDCAIAIDHGELEGEE